MTTIRDGRALGEEPRGLPVSLSRGVHPISLVAPGVIRRAPHELPVAVSPYPGRRPPRPGSSPQGGTMSRYAHPRRAGDLPLLTVVVDPAASEPAPVLSPDDRGLLRKAPAGTLAAPAFPAGGS